MDKQIESEDSMQAEGGKVCPSQSNNAKTKDKNEQIPENRDSASNLGATEHTTRISESTSSTIRPSSSASGQDVIVSNPRNPERNLNLSLRIASTPMANIPSLQVDSSQCRPSTSSSNESLQLAQEAKKETLDVDYQQNKIKFKQSPVKEKSDDSDSLGCTCNDERSEEAEKPRQKKSYLSKVLGRKSPSKSKAMSRKESAAKCSRSPSKSPSPNKSKSPKNTEKPSKKSLSPRDRRSKSPKDTRLARSPVVDFVEKSLNALFKKRHDSETEALCALPNSDDTPKTEVKEKEKKAEDHWKVGAIPNDFDLALDVNLSDTTCDSQSTRPSLVSMDSNPLQDEAAQAAQVEARSEDSNDPFEE